MANPLVKPVRFAERVVSLFPARRFRIKGLDGTVENAVHTGRGEKSGGDSEVLYVFFLLFLQLASVN